jgi:hypothetical protein
LTERAQAGAFRRALAYLVGGAFAVLAAVTLLVVIHAAFPYGWLVPPFQFLLAVLAALSLSALLMGILYAYKAYPVHRRAIAFIVVVTLATLLSHAYIIGLPAASQAGAVSGTVGGGFSDDLVSVDSAISSKSLVVTVSATGGQALGDVSVSLNGVLLQDEGLTPRPSLSSPIQPGGSTAGAWSLSSPVPRPSAVKVSYQALTCYSTSSKTYGCIMDEVFYVPEAMRMLSGLHCSTTAPDCHMEHPELVPALMAAGMAAFGTYNVAGWRVMPVLLGSLSIPLLFGIVWKASGNKTLAAYSSLLLALDVMFFSQSSGGLLDVPEVFFGLAAFLAYFAKVRVWRFDRYLIAGVFLGLAGLAKETAIFIALAFLTYILLFDDGVRAVRFFRFTKVILVLALVFVVGIQTYDSTLATSEVPTFVQHVSYILNYGSTLIAGKLACQPTTGYWCKFPDQPGGPPILPTDWLTFYTAVEYYATSTLVCTDAVNGVCQGQQRWLSTVAYYGVSNFLIAWSTFVWVPLASYALYSRFRKGKAREAKDSAGPSQGAEETEGETRLAALALIMFVWTYVPYILLFLAGRVTYPFYLVPAVPALAMGCGYWLNRAYFPKYLVPLYIGMVFVFFLVYFPSKEFLPVWLRVIIGH